MTGPLLVVVAGHPATGKTTLAILWRRPKLRGAPPAPRRAPRSAVARERWVVQIEDRALEQCGRLRAPGGASGAARMVIEANFEADEPRLREMAERAGARAVLVAVEADPDVVVERARRRAETGERHPVDLDALVQRVWST